MTTTDESVVKGIVVSSGTSFFWGMKILSYEQRRAMFALYAFCRKIDDIADNQQISKNEKLREISLWEKKLIVFLVIMKSMTPYQEKYL